MSVYCSVQMAWQFYNEISQQSNNENISTVGILRWIVDKLKIFWTSSGRWVILSIFLTSEDDERPVIAKKEDTSTLFFGFWLILMSESWNKAAYISVRCPTRVITSNWRNSEHSPFSGNPTKHHHAGEYNEYSTTIY